MVYNIVIDTKKEKYICIDFFRKNNVKILDIAGYFNQYIIHIEYRENISILDNQLQEVLKNVY